MKKTLNPLLEVVEKAFSQPKTKEELIEDGKAMERLMANKDFKLYQKLLMEAYLVLVKRIGLTQREDLPTIQGALMQHDMILALPEKVLRKAKEFVSQERSEE